MKMFEVLNLLNQPGILWTLFISSILLVLFDYLLPVDWLAYVGYLCFSIFVGATIAVTPTYSLVAMVAVATAMLLAHQYLFSRFLTNAPRYERRLTATDDLAPASKTNSL